MNQDHLAALLADTARAGVYRLPATGSAELRVAAKERGLACFRIDLADVHDKRAFLEALAKGLAFPPWFGHNWDALEECLTDMSWHQGKGFLVILARCAAFHDSAPLEFAMALRIFSAAADAWRDEGIPFWTLVDGEQGAAPDLPELP